MYRFTCSEKHLSLIDWFQMIAGRISVLKFMQNKTKWVKTECPVYKEVIRSFQFNFVVEIIER